MTPEQAASAAKPWVLELGGAFIECPHTLRRARLMGLSGWAFHIAGRAGALGDVRTETVAATMGFIAPEAVADGWEAARRVAMPGEVAVISLTECCRWGAEHLAHSPGVRRLAELTERVVAAADPTGMPLFAAWRAMPIPDDAPGARLAVLLHLLREHFAAAHLLAVRASGMSPLEAIIAGPEGEPGAVAYGWQPPYPPVGPLLRRWHWAEAVTDGIAGRAFAVLDPDERMELAQLLVKAAEADRVVPVGD
ncbi:hypothetical protein O7627_29135 [Solwaraspora sp. WMMD1047]|uniref:SCO6745 family protein n=1 Tax=Solwaraspora sp. WMMD1047 TaxID=3016102 RepID=UPI002415C482|nr:hypothetical protein [Solwaraspora sp. WMMD1047]MDG4833340.1 hypothetical protein [Solwaraspora sp. WMMD1047]